jgi:transcription-repair coupling factor (superfamily II helicase)
MRTLGDQKELLKRLRLGKIDVLIGTHRLLSKDVKYHDLGLLVIDEEQRFGVRHKETLKKIKNSIDVLTLSATPIPRTLHMSMLELREISLIETPPKNRFPVQTYVVEYSEELVRKAIDRELDREGQVYFLCNRIDLIPRFVRQLKNLIPKARIAMAHGRLGQRELAEIMRAFLCGKYNVLVSTTIIETGMDIACVNTLIVYDADRLGLSQLYQLRGRVGRSDRIAYAYFTYRPQKELTELATKRLEALKDFTALGAGFKVALRDLELRGVGNLLGSRQHGHMAAVGFDLYTEMLQQAICRLRGKPSCAKQEVLAQIMLKSVEAYLPASYVALEQSRLDMYKRLSSATLVTEIEGLSTELTDRFGPMPQVVQQLILVAKLRLYADEKKVALVKEESPQLFLFTFEESSQFTEQLLKLKKITAVLGVKMMIKATANVTIRIYMQNVPIYDKLVILERILREL